MKVHRNFKLRIELDRKLRKESRETNRTQTAILEMALAEWLGRKRGA